VPIVMEILCPESVIDFGCGLGVWLRALAESTVRTIWGIDGNYLERERLLIDPGYFVAGDLTEAFAVDKRYDLPLSIEVAEHLPNSSASSLIEQLTSAARAVLFSAAIPG
jgi:2-polyprenyl-3-methyl-5-hydroxy-6-metoxy-1,4-benzoquinol methylase